MSVKSDLDELEEAVQRDWLDAALSSSPRMPRLQSRRRCWSEVGSDKPLPLGRRAKVAEACDRKHLTVLPRYMRNGGSVDTRNDPGH